MHRRVFTHLLLALLLLFSQQMALAHVVAHEFNQPLELAGHTVNDGHDHSSSKIATSLAHADTCVQCLSFAQMANALAVAPRIFVPHDSVVHCPLAGTALPPARAAPCGFQPRAPPQA